ncbi:MAG: hypothetical protein IKG82_12270 [Oscillospiraceae bacterium]|nr:hypothetical protein [Oscillospiraceae bacterium]
MYKKEYAKIGTILGCVPAIYFFVADIHEMTLCCIIAGLLIGFIVGYNKDEELKKETAKEKSTQYQNAVPEKDAEKCAREAAEEASRKAAEEAAKIEERKHIETEALTQWETQKLIPVLKAFNEVTYHSEEYDEYDEDFGKDVRYRNRCILQFSDLKKDAEFRNSRNSFVDYLDILNRGIDKSIQELKTEINSILQELSQWDFKNLYYLADKLYQLSALTTDDGYLPAVIAASKISSARYSEIFTPYGKSPYSLNLDAKVEEREERSSDLESKIKKSLSQLTIETDHYYNQIVTYLYPEMPVDAALLLLYRASLMPLCNDKFEEACSFYCKLHNWGFDEPEPMMVLFARIYAKINIEGRTVSDSLLEEIRSWISSNTRGRKRKYCFEGINLASGLAWAGFYRLEWLVLKQMKESGVAVDDPQNKIEYYSKIEESNITVYDLKPTDIFMFDSSSEKWNENEFSACYWKMEIKGILPLYSFVISSWKKTLPFANGHSLIHEQLYSDFVALTNEYDGEIICKHVNAKAVNLVNLEYPNSTLFSFFSERSRGISVLFHCEKFGSNINITLLTLFTPEVNLSPNVLTQYTLAAKANNYVESFKESLLLLIDKKITNGVSIYEESSSVSNNPLFE